MAVSLVGKRGEWMRGHETKGMTVHSRRVQRSSRYGVERERERRIEVVGVRFEPIKWLRSLTSVTCMNFDRQALDDAFHVQGSR
jgi:hypothetical protein